MNHESVFALLTAIANHLWQSTLFAGLAALVALALRKNHARVRYQLWLAASLKFLIPFALLIRLGGHLITPYRPAETQPAFYFLIRTVSQPFTQTRSLTASLLPLLPGILASLWLCGFVTVIVLTWLR